MQKLLAILAVGALTASAQFVFPPAQSGGGGAANAAGSTGQLQYNAGGTDFGGFTLAGDCTISVPNIVCTKTNGVAFVASATTDTTIASNITSGLLPLAQGGVHADLSATGGTSQVLKQTTVGGNISVARLACADLSNAVASCSTDMTNLGNAVSGLAALARGGTHTDLSGSGGTHRVLFQSSAGSDITVAQPNFTDLAGAIAIGQITALSTNNALLLRDNTGAISQLTAATVGNGNCIGVNSGQFTGLGPCPGSGGGSGGGVNAKTGNYTALSGDVGKLVTMNGTSLTLLLPASPPSSSWFIITENLNATNLVIDRNSLNINGVAANFTVPQYQWVRVYTDGTNYFADPVTTAGSGITLTTSSTSAALSVNTAVIPSIATILQGDNTSVFSTTGNAAYVGSPAAGCATASLKSGAMIDLIPDFTSVTTATFNFCGLGVKNVKQSDGATNPGTTIIASIANRLQYDGTVWREVAGGGGSPAGVAGGDLFNSYPSPGVGKFASDINALAFAVCDGTTDDTAAFATMSALAVNIHIPAGLTCVINAPTITTHTHFIGGPNSRLLKLAGTTTTYLITTSSKSDLLFQNLILDGNSVVQTTSNLYSVFISGGSNITFDTVTFQNSGAPSTSMGGLDIFSASVIVKNCIFASTVEANQLTANNNNSIANRVQFLNNTLNGSQAKAIWVQNSGAEGVCNAEVAGNYINNVTDSAADAGQTGNAISIFQCDYVNVHDNQIKTVRYAGIRVATSSWTDVHDNTINGAQETAIYCSELGGGNNHCHHNTILNSASGINMTNVSSRSPDARNVADYNVCINVSYYCVYAEHDIATNNTADGVPFAFIAGHGSTSHDNVMTNNTCTQSSASYYPVDVCVGVDTGMTGTSIVGSNQTNGTTAPTISAQAATNTPSNLVITAITKAASAVVTTSSTLPASGSTVCFAQISGMVEINGLCGAVSSPSGSTFTVAINSTGFTTFTATPAGGTAPVGNALTVYSSGTTPANAFAANVTLGTATTGLANNAVTSAKMAIVNTRGVCSIVIGADNGAALATADIAPQGRQCFIPAASHVVEITVAADAGTPAVVVAKNSAGTPTALSASLATAASGGLACANAAGSGSGIDGATTCAVQITTTALAAGDWIETSTSASASTAKRMSISITYTID